MVTKNHKKLEISPEIKESDVCINCFKEIDAKNNKDNLDFLKLRKYVNWYIDTEINKFFNSIKETRNKINLLKEFNLYMSIIQSDSLYLDPRVIELWNSNEIYLLNELEKLLINKNELLKNKDPWEILLKIKDPIGFFTK